MIGGNAERQKVIQKKKKKILTCEELKDAGDGEPLSFGEGKELSHEHEDAQDGEDAREHGAGLHRLEVVCRGSQREGNTMRTHVCDGQEEACGQTSR